MAGAPDSGDDLLGLQRRRGAGLLDIGHRRRGIDVLWDPVHDEGGKCLESGRGSSPGTSATCIPLNRHCRLTCLNQMLLLLLLLLLLLDVLNSLLLRALGIHNLLLRNSRTLRWPLLQSR